MALALSQDAPRLAVLPQPSANQLSNMPSDQALMDELLGPDGMACLSAIGDALEAAGESKQQQVKIRLIVQDTDLHTFFPRIESLLTYVSGDNKGKARIDAVSNQKMRDAHPELFAQLNEIAARTPAIREQRLHALERRRTAALLSFAKVFLGEYEARKSASGALDYDDQIEKALALLSTSASTQWVLYRLDGGIDHILVDEAQDTSPIQWQIVAKLTDEFTAGEGAKDRKRTIFVVGDEKQSIYSFQGAAPGEFDRMREDFAERYKAIGQPFERTTLEHSFRSADTILRLVDETFADHAAAGFAEDEKHRAFKDRMPGRVDL